MTAMPPEPNEQLIRDLFEALNKRDLERAASYYAPEASLSFGAPHVGQRRKATNGAPEAHGVELRGQGEILAYYQWLLFEHRRSTTFELDELRLSGGITMRAPWHVESQDMAVLEEGVELFDMSDGRIVRHACAFDAPPEGLGRIGPEQAQDADEPDDEAEASDRNDEAEPSSSQGKFAERLKLYRENSADVALGKARLSQARLAELLSEALGDQTRSRSAIANWEQGLTQIDSQDRRVQLALVQILVESGGLKSALEANDLLEAGSYASLSREEEAQLFRQKSETEVKNPMPSSARVEWPAGKCLIGVGGASYDVRQVLLPGDLDAIRLGRVEAVWLPMTAGAEQVAALRAVNPNIFLLVGLYRDLRPSGETPDVYVAGVAAAITPLYAAGVRYFEIQGLPGSNLDIWRALIGSLESFAAWFVEVHTRLKARYPEAHFGLPAVRLPDDPSWDSDNALFLDQADPAARAADWISVPGQWTRASGGQAHQGDRLYQNYRARYPDKLLFITDALTAGADNPPDVQARDFVAYFQALRNLPNLGAAFAHVLLAGPAGVPRLWLAADGTPGLLPQVLGARRWGEPGDPPENFAGFATNDRPDGKDELGYDDYARAFVRVLSNPDTKTPLTIGIYGAWGMGKSFLMKRVRAFVEEGQKEREQARRRRPLAERAWEGVKRLRPLRRAEPEAAAGARGRPGARLQGVFTRPASHAVDFHCVEFNAWVYSGSENLWAGLITHLYNEVEKYLGLGRTGLFRLGENARRAARKTIGLLLLYGVLGLVFSLLLNSEQIRAGVSTFQQALTTLAGAVALGGTVAAALAALPPLLAALRDLANSLTLARSEQLAALASRRDFRDKIGFMADIKDEIRMIRRLLDAGRDGVRTRLVVFIDDLDRCEPKKAVEVLEAIMLLLADEDGMPFVVVLGIDARIVVKAVEERYGKVLTEAGISGYEYLDKIVQIPFRIPPPQSGALANYVSSLLWRSPQERQDFEDQAAEAKQLEAQRQQAEAAGLGDSLQPVLRDRDTFLGQLQQSAEGTGREAEVAAIRRRSEAGRGLPPGGSRQAVIQQAQASVPPPITLPPTPEVSFLPDEREAFERYAQADHLSPNPRRVKRILNIYRVVRLLRPNTSAAERQQMIKWVVLTEQWPYRTAWLMQAAEDDAQLPKDKRQLKDSDGLSKVYERVLAEVRAKDAQPFAGLDADPDLFDGFIASDPPITVADLRRLRPLTFNLNPALQGEVMKAVTRRGGG